MEDCIFGFVLQSRTKVRFGTQMGFSTLNIDNLIVLMSFHDSRIPRLAKWTEDYITGTTHNLGCFLSHHKTTSLIITPDAAGQREGYVDFTSLVLC